MKNLSKYINKEVKLIDIDGEVFVGKIEAYTPGIDSEDEQDEIAILVDGSLIGFEENEIESIEEL